MKRYERAAALLLALLMALSLCAGAEQGGADVENPLEIGTAEAFEEAVAEAVEPEAGECELSLGDAEDAGAVAVPTFAPPELPTDEAVSEPTPAVSEDTEAEPLTEDGPSEPEETQAVEETAAESGETEDTASEDADGTREDAPTASDAPQDEPTPEPGDATPEPESATVESEAATPEPEAVTAEPEAQSAKLVSAAAASAETTAVTLGVGERTTLQAPAGQGSPVYTTSNKKIATVTAKGVVKGVRRGSARVVVTRGGARREYTVSVVRAPKKLRFSEKTLYLGYDQANRQADQLKLNPRLTSGSHSAITYSGYNPRVVNVSGDGTVTAVGIGSTRITARTYNKKKATVKIRVLAAPGTLSLNKGTLNICKGAGYTLKGVMPRNTASTLRFSVDNPNIARVDASGRLTALAEGTACVEASTFNGLKASCKVVVSAAPKASQQAFASVTLGVGQRSAPMFAAAKQCVIDGCATFTTSRKKIATVDSQGVIRGRRKGTATVKAKFRDGSVASVRVTVLKAPTKVKLSAGSMTLQRYNAAYLRVSFPKGQSGSYTYSSSKTSVATVDSTGLVTAVARGSAVITVKAYNGKKAKCTVNVVTSTPDIRLSDTLSFPALKYTDIPMQVVASDGGAFKGPVKVTVSPSDVATYEDGKLLGRKAGRTATVTVTAGATTKTCKVTFTKNPDVQGIKAIAHRGAKGHWTENSLTAFKNFPSLGADGVELDIRSDKDGLQVIFHDATLKGSDGVVYTVADQSYETLRQVNGVICTLDEALDVIAATGKDIYMNPKETADGAKCVEAIRAHGLESRTMYFTGNEGLLRQIYAADPTAVIGYTLTSGTKAISDALVAKARDLHARYIVPHKSLMSQKLVEYWHGKGFLVMVWTVNDRKTTQSVMAMGVDAVLSDYPEYCVEARS